MNLNLNLNLSLNLVKTLGTSLRLARGLQTSSIALSGHSKWSTIKHDKAKADSQRSQLITKFASMIIVASKLGGPDPDSNVRLSTTIAAALKANVPKKIIESSINRGQGLTASGEKKNLDTMLYEGIGPGNVSFVIEALTDNKNRTIDYVRATFGKFGGKLSPTLFQFDRRGFVVINPVPGEDFETTFERLINDVDGIEDLEEVVDDETHERTIEVLTEPTETNNVSNAIKDKGYEIKEVGLTFIPKPDMMVEALPEDVREKYDKFVAALDGLDDVTDYYSNLK